MSLCALSGSRNSGWFNSRFSPERKAVGVLTSLRTSITKEEITAVRPRESSAARSVAWIRVGVIC